MTFFVSDFNVSCSVVSNCSNITGDVTCDTQSGKCSCAEGNVRMKMHHHCLPCKHQLVFFHLPTYVKRNWQNYDICLSVFSVMIFDIF